MQRLGEEQKLRPSPTFSCDQSNTAVLEGGLSVDFLWEGKVTILTNRNNLNRPSPPFGLLPRRGVFLWELQNTHDRLREPLGGTGIHPHHQPPPPIGNSWISLDRLPTELFRGEAGG